MYEVIPCPNLGTKYFVLRDSNDPSGYIDDDGESIGKLVREGNGRMVKFATEQEAKEYEAK